MKIKIQYWPEVMCPVTEDSIADIVCEKCKFHDSIVDDHVICNFYKKRDTEAD
jgi:hypothetical protein